MPSMTPVSATFWLSSSTVGLLTQGAGDGREHACSTDGDRRGFGAGDLLHVVVQPALPHERCRVEGFQPDRYLGVAIDGEGALRGVQNGQAIHPDKTVRL